MRAAGQEKRQVGRWLRGRRLPVVGGPHRRCGCCSPRRRAATPNLNPGDARRALVSAAARRRRADLRPGHVRHCWLSTAWWKRVSTTPRHASSACCCDAIRRAALWASSPAATCIRRSSRRSRRPWCWTCCASWTKGHCAHGRLKRMGRGGRALIGSGKMRIAFCTRIPIVQNRAPWRLACTTCQASWVVSPPQPRPHHPPYSTRHAAVGFSVNL